MAHCFIPATPGLRPNIGEDAWKKIDAFRGRMEGETTATGQVVEGTRLPKDVCKVVAGYYVGEQEKKKKSKYQEVVDALGTFMAYARCINGPYHYECALQSIEEYMVACFLMIGSKSGQFVSQRIRKAGQAKERSIRGGARREFPLDGSPAHKQKIIDEYWKKWGPAGHNLGDLNFVSQIVQEDTLDKYLKMKKPEDRAYAKLKNDVTRAFDAWFDDFMRDIIVGQVKDLNNRSCDHLAQRMRRGNWSMKDKYDYKSRRDAREKVYGEQMRRGGGHQRCKEYHERRSLRAKLESQRKLLAREIVNNPEINAMQYTNTNDPILNIMVQRFIKEKRDRERQKK